MKAITVGLSSVKTVAPVIGAAALFVGLLSSAALAQTAPSLPNGNFSISGSTSLTTSDTYIDTGSPITNSTALPGWTATGSGYACVALSPTITASTGYCGTGISFTTSPGTVPGGYNGNIFIDDANAGYLDTITATITVTASASVQTYALSFYYAGAQQSGYTGQTQDWWEVGFNGVTPAQVTPSITIGNNGTTNPTDLFEKQTVDFTVAAGATSETVSFMAAGTGSTGSNQPPFMMLADLSVAQVPEPGSLALLGCGLLGLLGLRKRARA